MIKRDTKFRPDTDERDKRKRFPWIAQEYKQGSQYSNLHLVIHGKRGKNQLN